MHIYYHDLFTFPLPAEHRFPISKYARLRDRVTNSEIAEKIKLIIPNGATDTQLALAHTPAYIEKVKIGDLSRQEIRRMGFPWSPELVERSRRSVGSSISASRIAIQEGAAVNIAGGTHHAGVDHGEGFCVFNDAAVAARVLQAEGLIEKVLIIDTDVHQGNGTASILAGDDSIFTFSIHGQKNFPFRKSKSDLDIGLPDNTEDKNYLLALEQGLRTAFSTIQPNLVIFISGADPYTHDRLGRLSISKAGLASRDSIVFRYCKQFNVPVAVAMGGGYAKDVEEIVDIHYETVAQALNYWKSVH